MAPSYLFPLKRGLAEGEFGGSAGVWFDEDSGDFQWSELAIANTGSKKMQAAVGEIFLVPGRYRLSSAKSRARARVLRPQQCFA